MSSCFCLALSKSQSKRNKREIAGGSDSARGRCVQKYNSTSYDPTGFTSAILLVECHLMTARLWLWDSRQLACFYHFQVRFDTWPTPFTIRHLDAGDIQSPLDLLRTWTCFFRKWEHPLLASPSFIMQYQPRDKKTVASKRDTCQGPGTSLPSFTLWQPGK